ncbi:MAG: hypothetical protein E6K64_04070 [Nitrospirae bacterium]|nr:MAG: hypothetical protein E6K64_04070 [Nitrospirota bacterium]
MLENWFSKNPSNRPKPLDQHGGLSNIIDRIKDQFERIIHSDHIKFLSQLSVGYYIVLIGVTGILLYTGYRLGQSGNRALPTSTAVLSESSGKVTKLEADLSLVKSALQERIKSFEGSLKEREAQIKEHENVISSLRNEIKELQSKLSAEQNKNAELLIQSGPSETTISELQKARLSLPKPLRHKGFQMQLSPIISPKGYLIWAPEHVTEDGFYIDGTHYALFKCLQKIAPMDLLGEVERKNLFFAITVGDKVLSPVPYLYMLPLEEGKHKIKIEPLSGSAENNSKETVVKLMARQVEFIEIDSIAVLSEAGAFRVKLKTFDQESTVRRISKVLETMHVDNDCLLEVLTTR